VILRPAGDAVLAIGQASHAWLAGQLARAWGNDRFPAPAPFEAVCLGALQHDIGMAAWDLRPERHPGTGLPRQFFELDRVTHLELWTDAPQRVLSQSRYAALLVSLHGTGLYERYPPRRDDPAVAAAVDEYLQGQYALQDRLIDELGADREEVGRNQGLLATWDQLSLALCQDAVPAMLQHVPAGVGGPLALAVQRVPDAPDDVDAVTVDPWPFSVDRLEVVAEGRRLEHGEPDEAALHAALERAPVLTVRVVLSAPG
jgi:Protein of unknown function (DUF3891)